jgi:hypothetical protein
VEARKTLVGLLLALAASMAGAGAAQAANPAQATLSPDAKGNGKVTWTGSMSAGYAVAGVTDDCFGADKKPDPTSGCDFFKLDVNAPPGFYDGFLGGVQIDVSGFGPTDIDLGVYRRNPDGTRGDSAGSSGNVPGSAERTTLADATGAYYVVLVPYAAPPGTSYTGVASFKGQKANPPLAILNTRIGLGPVNYRASHDQYISH